MAGRMMVAVFAAFGLAAAIGGFAGALFIVPQDHTEHLYRVASALLGVGGLVLLAQAATMVSLARMARQLAERPAVRRPSEPHVAPRPAQPKSTQRPTRSQSADPTGPAERSTPRLILEGTRQAPAAEHPLRRTLSAKRSAEDRKTDERKPDDRKEPYF